MTVLFIPFLFTPGAKGIYLKEMTGADELTVGSISTPGVLALLEALSQSGHNGQEGIDVCSIVTADRDRIIAQLYQSLYGSRVASTLECSGCGQQYDLDFSLDDLLVHCYRGAGGVPEDGIYEVGDGIRFRLPSGEDELAVQAFDEVAAERMMLERCMVSGESETDGERVQMKMAEIAPVLSQEMQAVCPECHRTQQLLFDMQSFFLARVIGERQSLYEEVHLIASHYRWSRGEILGLPRRERKQYATMITGN